MRPDRRTINRANSAHSTGPKSEAGKQRSSLNALRHGLTGQVIVLPTDDHIAYEKHTHAFHYEYQPQGPTETHLTQTLADAAWRLNRLRALETNLLTIGLQHHARATKADHPQAHAALATASGTEDHTRQLAILSLHESRLTRQFDKTLIQLRALQSERQAQRQTELKAAASLLQHHEEQTTTPYDPAEDGFVFSTQEIAAYIRLQRRKSLAFHAGHTRAA